MQKPLLLSIAVIVGFGVCAVFLLKARSEPAVDPAAGSASGSTASSASAESFDGLSEEASPPPASPTDAPQPGRAHAAPARPAQVELHSDLAGLSDMASDAKAPSTNEGRVPEGHLFAVKYAPMSARERRGARDAIEARLLAHRLGTEDKGQALTDQQVVELGREIEWLQAHANP